MSTDGQILRDSRERYAKKIAHQRKVIKILRGALEELAGGVCCKTPGCCADDPHCDVSVSRAALKQIGELGE